MTTDLIPCSQCEGNGCCEVPGTNMRMDADSPEWRLAKCDACDGEGELDPEWTDDQRDYVYGLEATIADLRARLAAAAEGMPVFVPRKVAS